MNENETQTKPKPSKFRLFLDYLAWTVHYIGWILFILIICLFILFIWVTVSSAHWTVYYVGFLLSILVISKSVVAIKKKNKAQTEKKTSKLARFLGLATAVILFAGFLGFIVVVPYYCRDSKGTLGVIGRAIWREPELYRGVFPCKICGKMTPGVMCWDCELKEKGLTEEDFREF